MAARCDTRGRSCQGRQHCSCWHIPCAIMRDSWHLSPAAQLATSPQPHPLVLIDCPLKYFQLLHPCNSQRRRSPVPAQPLTCCSICHPPALPTGRFFALQLAKLGREWRADASRRMPVARGDIREIVGQVRTLLKQGRVGGVACGNLVSSVNEVNAWSVHRVGGVARGQVVACEGLRARGAGGSIVCELRWRLGQEHLRQRPALEWVKTALD